VAIQIDVGQSVSTVRVLDRASWDARHNEGWIAFGEDEV
jgi:hypothetical protein